MRKLGLLYIIVFFLSGNLLLKAQNFAHELGVMGGPANFRSDFGVRGDSETNLKNTGYGVGVIHYFNFAYRASCSCFTELTYFNDHFKLRSEISHYRGNLRHYGEWVDRSSITSDILREMRGKYSITNIGSQLEYYPMSIREFGARGYQFAPFLSLGFHYSFFNSEVSSTRPGGIQNPANSVKKYRGDAVTIAGESGGSILSVVSSIGTRYKIGRLSDLILELRWQYYFSDDVDGMNPNSDIYTENIANDWMVWFNVGYVYTFL
jgi:hypothetical protein